MISTKQILQFFFKIDNWLDSNFLKILIELVIQ